MGFRFDSFKAWLRTVVNDGETLRRSGNGFASVALAASSEANTFTAAQTIAPTVATSGARTALTLTTPADTGITATTEQTDLYYNGSSTRTWATGTVAAQRFWRLRAPTIAAAGASTFTYAALLDLEGAPIAGTSATITTSYVLRAASGRVLFGGAVVFNAAQVVQHTSDLTVGPTITTPAMTVRVPSGSTSVTVTHASVATTTRFRYAPLTLASNSVYVRAIVPGSGSFVLTLSGDPGASHADFFVELVQPGAGT